jgi:tRNA(fMet)-specific endonuclease VapC
MRYMLDTNICIYLIKQHSASVVARLNALGDVLMSVVTCAKLRAGLEMHTSNRAHDEQVLGLLTNP